MAQQAWNLDSVLLVVTFLLDGILAGAEKHDQDEDEEDEEEQDEKSHLQLSTGPAASQRPGQEEWQGAETDWSSTHLPPFLPGSPGNPCRLHSPFYSG